MTALLLDVVTTAAILFAVASGLLLVFGVMKIINFAHGGLITLGGYAALITTQLGLNPWFGIPMAALFGAVAGTLIERIVVRPLYARPLDAILATWGLGIIIGQTIVLVFGREVQFAAAPLGGTIDLLGESYSLYRIVMVPIAILLGLGIALLLNGTRLGLATRAVIMNEDLARGLGIDSTWVRFVTFALGSALAAVAGALITPLSSVDPNMGVPWLVNAFMLVLVSGTSLASLAAACLVLGGAQVVVSSLYSPVLGGITIALLAAIILRTRPQGFARG
ncbi:branched-chain amino acid ABC transporter permease [Prosthecomicrobium hirschii]|uniref:branched-chain amino acid ABC transporter permease n=1 Tax=Prosthecodimorpha hirschii TaxID=665126 RepID=UPI00221FBED8|nr:branched-chain amino acid ABC transporter permease [Prosthecomicrobium hirschii]MCW1838725.1 branched-chain amino acid ABC transporter permease [Prosthecomicrobium hirschii]